MRILLLSDHANPHTIKWATSLSDNGVEVGIFSLSLKPVDAYATHPNVIVKQLEFDDTTFKSGGIAKAHYLKSLPNLKRFLKEFKPDILHAHYASSYGLLGRLCRFHPYIISVWGTDVYGFPKSSKINARILKGNLKKADVVLSTSRDMARETQLYTDKEIEITPFGIDLDVFKPKKVKRPFSTDDIIIGTVKTLEQNYGIDLLIDAFHTVKQKHVDLPLKLLIVGGGSLAKQLEEQVNQLGIQDVTHFTGNVPFSEISTYHNMLDVYVAASASESFGVAIIESSACEKPVVVTNVGGLPEVVDHNVTGLIVKERTADALAVEIEKLATDKALRIKMGKEGRAKVKNEYEWSQNVKQMIGIYKKLLK